LLNSLIPFMLRQAQHERNQLVTVQPKLVEGFVQRFLNGILSVKSTSERINLRVRYNIAILKHWRNNMTATVSIHIDQQLFEQAQHTAELEHRSTSEQIEFWAKLGQAALENPDLPVSFIAESLLSLMESHTALEPFVPRSRQA
jgi:hypothetical protein